MAEIETTSAVTSATVVMNTAGTNAPPNRGRSNRNRGGRHRGGIQNRERHDGTGRSNAETMTMTDGAPIARGGRPANLNTRGGHGSRGQRTSRRGGANISQRTTVGAQRAFGGHLTTEHEAEELGEAGLSADAKAFVPGQAVHGTRGPRAAAASKSKPQLLSRGSKSTAPDLSTRIHEDISNGQYECVICTNEVLPNSRVWSCSICWTVAHLSCVRKWYANQMKKPEQPGAQAPSGWRCPGCNSSMTEEPTSYHCWCGKETNPTTIPGLPPHSCGQTCSKPRPTCPHPCGASICHAGPCPPCEMMGPTISCFCGRHTSTKRCGETDYANGWSCLETCEDLLPCGEHECSRTCHSGLCGSCEIPMPSLCYCGREFKEISCELRGDREPSFNHGQLEQQPTGVLPETEGLGESWFMGSFTCDAGCGRTFDCGIHSCQKECHAQQKEVSHCPFAPDMVTHCPCGRTPIMDLLKQPRETCSNAIPNCQKRCDKLLTCGHQCQSGCHDSSCPPCMQHMDIACRCGRTTSKSVCHQGSTQIPECMRVCRAQLNCGRHLHDLHCCPGEKRAIERVAAKRRRRNPGPSSDDFEAEHICIRQCGRPLKCNKHDCQQLCHSGPCPSCPEAIFEEISCHCGRTVLQPPQPCGTRPPECRFECVRGDRPCGHPRIPHACHPDDKPCPPCPFLVEKKCICGKQNLKNQPCWFEEPRCGLICGKKLKCGTHLCTMPCHRPGECEDAGVRGSHCTQPCLKVRKSCDHVDTDPCHAPYPCKEDKPCQAKTFVTCECQHRKQEVKCLASKSNPWPERQPLKCDDECLRLHRNARLAAALNIDPEAHVDNHVPYSDTALKFFRDNTKWAQPYEREFRVFATEPNEKRLRFKPMKSHQRAFLHALAEDYGLDSESQDPEPHRHVSIFKTPRFVSAPLKTLAQCVRIRAADLAPGSSAQQEQASVFVPTEPFNALILSSPRFALTIEEVETALKGDLALQPTVSFMTSFLPSDEIVLRGSGAWTPQALESSVSALKPSVAQTVTRQNLAKSVSLCHVDSSLNVLRREVDGSKSADGWSSVVSRSAARPPKPASSAAVGMSSAGSGLLRNKFVVLKKEPKKKVEEQPVAEDWEAAAENLDGEA
ncbi:NF-X1 type zinc finger protein [Xylariales sp. AK1849]|nr:NF-X1 type zinc finger protein [Xylariales sp. AK1849]